MEFGGEAALDNPRRDDSQPDEQQPADLTHRQLLFVLSGIMVGMALGALDQTIVATALPTIAGDLGDLENLSWVVTAYLVAQTVSMPIYGRLGDVYGRKRCFQTAIVLFILGSALAGLSQSMPRVIASRAVQGLGAGGLGALAQAMIADVVSPRERGRYQGYFSAIFMVASVAGPLVGGVITHQLSWHWIFFVNIPLGCAALIVTQVSLPASRPPTRTRIDWLGSAALSVTIGSTVLVASWGGSTYAWGSPVVLALIFVAATAGTLFCHIELRVAAPVLPLRLFRIRTFTLATAIGLIVGVAIFSAVTFMPTFLQVANGVPVGNSGLLLMPLIVGMVITSWTAGILMTRRGRYRVFPVSGLLVAAIGMFLMSTLGTGSPRWVSSLYMFVFGLGLGMVMHILVVATQNEVPYRDLGVATSTITLSRGIGGSIGIAFLGTLFATRVAAAGSEIEVAGLTPEMLDRLPDAKRLETAHAFASGITDVFTIGAIILFVAFCLSLMLHEKALRTNDIRAEEPAFAVPEVV